MSIVRGKVAVPRLPIPHLPRPRVQKILEDALDKSTVVVVSAGAGTGKSAALAEAVNDLDRPIAWLSVDTSDQAPGRLLAYLEAAMCIGDEDASEGLVAAGLAANIPPTEVAGLLIESVGEARPVIVLDNLHRLGRSGPAWQVIEAMITYSVPGSVIVLVVPHELAAEMMELPIQTKVTVITDHELALEVTEATDLLDLLGEDSARAAELVQSNNGWLSGVIFGVDDFQAALPGSEGTRYDFLSERIFSRLNLADQGFLIRTSVLATVSVEAAMNCGLAEVDARLDSLRRLHLPATWDPEQLTLRYYPRFKEFLLNRFARLPIDEQRRIRHAHGRMLISQGDHESAVDELLRAGDSELAFASARRSIIRVAEHADFEVVVRWLETFAAFERDDAPTELTAARLAFAFSRQDAQDAQNIVSRLEHADSLSDFIRSYPTGAELVAWVFATTGRRTEFVQLLETVKPTAGLAALRYGYGLVSDGSPLPRPARSHTALDAFAYLGDYYLGRLDTFFMPPTSRLAQIIIEPYRIASLRARGQTEAALRAYRAYSSEAGRLQLTTLVGPEVLIDAGLYVEADETAIQGIERARSVGHTAYELIGTISRVKLALRVNDDTLLARDLLMKAQGLQVDGFHLLEKAVSSLRAAVMLRDNENESAVVTLRHLVRELETYGHPLDLPRAYVLLSEAEWRAGNDDKADLAADLAVEVSRKLGTNHLLLQALTDFPTVLTRRLATETASVETWYQLSNSAALQSMPVLFHAGEPQVHFADLGTPRLVRDKNETFFRLAKSAELFALLLQAPNRIATRRSLITNLFDQGDTTQTRNYLRQSLKWLRAVLPDGAVETTAESIRLSEHLGVLSDSSDVERRIVEAARQSGNEKIKMLQKALAILRSGEFLSGSTSEWTTRRRSQLESLTLDSEMAIAHEYLLSNRPLEAGQVLQHVLEVDPYRESAWQLRMLIALELNDRDALLAAYRACAKAMRDIDVAPSAFTQKLLKRLV